MTAVKIKFFTAPWCGPCKLVAGKIQSVSDELGCPLTTIDIDAERDLARKHGVDHLPTVLWIKGDVEISRQVGAVTRSQLVTVGRAACLESRGDIC